MNLRDTKYEEAQEANVSAALNRMHLAVELIHGDPGHGIG